MDTKPLKRKARNSADDLLGCLLAPYLSRMEVPNNIGITFRTLRNKHETFACDFACDVKKTHETMYDSAKMKNIAQSVRIEAELVRNKLYLLGALPKSKARDAKVHQLHVYLKKLEGCYIESVKSPVEMMVAFNMIAQHSETV